MYIKSIVLDGFKSYGRRVEIHGFDTQFNAITGLNGTGKSNILDSICFVLGISNLSHVRAGNLQDLIFKSGQAGINKASVSITFDNRNLEQSPPGYEHYNEIVITRQVVMGGKNKYWINGIVVQNKKVHDLFCSIQLNVNNPHFLIMQGRVTKVLNMKPHEILAMVEEAAGTRMYETKRQSAQKTIEKKDQKLQELNSIIREEVLPKLEKLRVERQSYLEFLRIERELEHMVSLYHAWLYYATQRSTEKAKEKLTKCQNKVKSIEDNIEKNKETVEDITNAILLITKESQEKEGGELKTLADTVKSIEKQEAKANAELKTANENIISEEKRIIQFEKNLKEDTIALDSKKLELANVQNLFETLKQNDERDTGKFMLSQKKYEAVCAGMEVDDDGQAATLEEQFMKAKQEAAAASTEMKTANMELKHCQTQMKLKEKEVGTDESEYKKDQTNLQNVKKEIKTLEDSLSRLNYSEEKINEIQSLKRDLTTDIKRLKDNIENFEARRPYTKFNYRDPEPNFNKSKVCGVVCKLFKLKDPLYSTALETAAGSKLYNVIVENDYISKLLLQKGQLQSRTTFIPLNKIKGGGGLNNNIIKCAQDLVGKENVKPAISLIDYDKKLQPAMEFVFGNIFICSNMNAARQVTFNDNIRKTCVTLEGDVTDPGGTLSGGARFKGTPVLLQIAEIGQSENLLLPKMEEFKKIEREVGQIMSNHEQYENLKRQLEIKQHELCMLTKRIEQTTHHQQQNELNLLTKSIVDLKERVQKCKEIEVKCMKKATELESTMKDSKGHKERMLKAAESEMKQMKKQADKSKNEWQKREQEYGTLAMEINELEKSIENTNNQVKESQLLLLELKEKKEVCSNSLKEIKTNLAALQAEYKEVKNSVASKNKEMQEMVKTKEQLLAQNSQFELDIRKMDHEIMKFQEEYNSAKLKENDVAKKSKKMDEKNLKDAKELSDKDGLDLQNKISKAQDKRHKLSRTVNTKAQSMFEHEEKQYNMLLRKMSIVESDKKNLLSVIADLDKQKKEAIQLAYDQVKKDFGSIFGTLLPGSNATLKAPDGKTILQGLEVKVSLGGVWKESLSELSGGQRSLVALSLILAMLLFKPAPLYILDEVDAALDLSHTQNIGNMLKSHFKQSQFIIVSLKDGMFNNANVLFRTKFIDGMSTVSRSVNKAN